LLPDWLLLIGISYRQRVLILGDVLFVGAFGTILQKKVTFTFETILLLLMSAIVTIGERLKPFLFYLGLFWPFPTCQFRNCYHF
jgi:hypothetical protein